MSNGGGETRDARHQMLGGGGALLAISRGTDGRKILRQPANARYKAANIENDYSGAELAV